MADAVRSVQEARDAGAPKWAANDLRAAEQLLSRAQSANLNQEYADAARLAEQAEVGADLAAERAKLARGRAEVATLEQQNAALQRDLAGGNAEAQP